MERKTTKYDWNPLLDYKIYRTSVENHTREKKQMNREKKYVGFVIGRLLKWIFMVRFSRFELKILARQVISVWSF